MRKLIEKLRDALADALLHINSLEFPGKAKEIRGVLADAQVFLDHPEPTRRNLRSVPELPCGAHLIAIAYGTGRDEYLAIVLGYIPDPDNREWEKFVTWTWNSSVGFDGFGSGRYMERKTWGDRLEQHAWSDFSDRAKGFVNKPAAWQAEGLLK